MTERTALWLYALMAVAIIIAELEHMVAARKSQQLADLSMSLVELELRQRAEHGERLFDRSEAEGREVRRDD